MGDKWLIKFESKARFHDFPRAKMDSAGTPTRHTQVFPLWCVPCFERGDQVERVFERNPPVAGMGVSKGGKLRGEPAFAAARRANIPRPGGLGVL